jgi:hypothetical protein
MCLQTQQLHLFFKKESEMSKDISSQASSQFAVIIEQISSSVWEELVLLYGIAGYSTLLYHVIS